ncbi:MAG: HNH endonuclease signature motif containing protein, partial [Motilibacteraceae bacterium]
ATANPDTERSPQNPLLPAVPEGQEPLPGLAAVQDVLAAGPQVQVPWAGAPTAHGRAVLPVIVFSGDALLDPDGEAGSEPALLRGHGPVPAAVARDLILAEQRWRIALVDQNHQLLAVDTYEPSQAIRDFAMTKHERCSTPGCTNPATRCDLDHEQAHADGGPTAADNLPPRCRFCHILKTLGNTSIDSERDEHGETRRVLRMPSGHTYPLTDPPLTEQGTVGEPADGTTSGWGGAGREEIPF